MPSDEKDSLVEANLTDIFNNEKIQNSHIGRRLRKMIESAERSVTPPFPRQVQIETSNICNHKCKFCAHTLMKRPMAQIDRSRFERLVKEAHACGAREIGLFAGAEPLACKNIVEHIQFCKDIGYEYLYISTNGALGNKKLYKRMLDSGLDSIKFSINAGDKEEYISIHGRNDFEKVISNLKFVGEYRKNLGHRVYVGVSFVGMDTTKGSFQNLKSHVSGYIDEIIYYDASNQSGQMHELPNPPYRECHLPFNKVHISLEGFLKACCNDYENYLAIEDLSKVSMIDAWHSKRFQHLRQMHIENKLEGLVCANCIHASKVAPMPINEVLASRNAFWSYQERRSSEGSDEK